VSVRSLRVVGVARDGRHNFRKSATDSIRLLTGIGIEGDAHAGAHVRHRYLARRSPQLANQRQVHLIAAELFDALRAAGYVVRSGDLGENVTTSGLELEALPLGAVLELGAEARVELTGLRTPCVLIDRFQAGLRKQMDGNEAGGPRFRCGVMGVVRCGGTLSVGDPIGVSLPALPWTDLPAI
jgi:MOSC domain-containing protein YiiM